jgi:hypothetical protein
LDAPKTFRPFQKGRIVANELKFVVILNGSFGLVLNFSKAQTYQNHLLKNTFKFTGNSYERLR